MASYIFVTSEGFTYQPGSESAEPDIENLQVLGFATGANERLAFENLISENSWLRESHFVNVSYFELRLEDYSSHSRRFNIDDAR